MLMPTLVLERLSAAGGHCKGQGLRGVLGGGARSARRGAFSVTASGTSAMCSAPTEETCGALSKAASTFQSCVLFCVECLISIPVTGLGCAFIVTEEATRQTDLLSAPLEPDWQVPCSV